MDRLTKRDESGCLNHPWEFNGVNGSYDIWDEDLLEKQIERLASYEDTGLEPEEIKDSIGWMSPVCVRCDGKTSDGIRTEKCGYPDNIAKCLEQSKHLLELAKAEQDGRLVVLPCSMDTTVYEIRSFYNRSKVVRQEIVSGEIDHFTIGEALKPIANVCLQGNEWADYEPDDLILTREEAEAALSGKAVNPNG